MDHFIITYSTAENTNALYWAKYFADGQFRRSIASIDYSAIQAFIESIKNSAPNLMVFVPEK